MAPTGADLYHCSDCRLWDDGKGFDPDKQYNIWTLPNGMTMNIPGVGTIPLHSDFVPCSKHKAELEAA